jgi:xylose isomerase
MRTYLILKDRAAAFRKDPRVIAAMKNSHIDQLLVPTLAAGETWRDLAADLFDVEAAGERAYHYEVLDQLAMEHLMGVSI